ncbi:MAG: hypothetical protein M1823_000410 [Watsoniomyces obsoletus]|nr:MAG: hypothetical protein M1823_000410 [Watsoniomyces obsoletus]
MVCSHVFTGVVIFSTLSGSVVANPVPASAGWVARTSPMMGPRDLKIVACTPHQEMHLREVLQDAATLGRQGAKMADRKNKAYEHYFRTDPKHADYQNDWRFFRSAMSAIRNSNDPVLAFHFVLKCAKDQKSHGCLERSAAVTSIEADNGGKREMVICPRFFTDEATKRVIGGEKEKSRWCEGKNQKTFGDFETGGHTMLHEMTHLDAMMKAAGVTETEYQRDDGSKFESSSSDDWAGTDAAQGPFVQLVQLARQLVPWTRKGRRSCWRNAENYAAAATEYYFMELCGIDDIPLR